MGEHNVWAASLSRSSTTRSPGSTGRPAATPAPRTLAATRFCAGGPPPSSWHSAGVGNRLPNPGVPAVPVPRPSWPGDRWWRDRGELACRAPTVEAGGPTVVARLHPRARAGGRAPFPPRLTQARDPTFPGQPRGDLGRVGAPGPAALNMTPEDGGRRSKDERRRARVNLCRPVSSRCRDPDGSFDLEPSAPPRRAAGPVCS